MQPTYKKIQTLKPHCSICGERLQGDGNIILPYKCSCSEWERDMSFQNGAELKLKKKGE